VNPISFQSTGYGFCLRPSTGKRDHRVLRIAPRSLFAEFSGDSAVANTKQFTVEANSYAQVFVASAVGCGRSSPHRLLADPDSVGKSKTSTCEKDGECQSFAGFVSQRDTCGWWFSWSKSEKNSCEKEPLSGRFTGFCRNSHASSKPNREESA
jgi:hypothetical protein